MGGVHWNSALEFLYGLLDQLFAADVEEHKIVPLCRMHFNQKASWRYTQQRKWETYPSQLFQLVAREPFQVFLAVGLVG